MRPVTVSAGPFAAASANNIATSQTPAVAARGSAAATFTGSSASIAATNSFISGQPVQFVPVGANLPANIIPYSTYFVIATGLTSSHFEVALTPGGSAVTPSVSGTGNVSYGPNVALNGSLVNSSGVAVLDNPRRVKITTADTTTTFTITGTDAAGNIISESLTNSGSSVTSALDYATVTSITTNQAPTAALTVGTATGPEAATPWVRCDEYAPGPVSIQVDVTGTINYTIQSTLDDPNLATNPVTPSAMTWVNTSDTAAVNATANVQTNFQFPPVFVRALINSSTSPGALTMTVSQIGAVPY